MSSTARNDVLRDALAEYYRLSSVEILSPLSYPAIDPACAPEKPSCWRVIAGDKEFLLKRYKTGKKEKRIEFEEEFQIRLFAQDPTLVPELVTTTGGKTHFQIESGEFLRLEPFIPSSHYPWWRGEWSEQQCEAAALFLKRFHDASMHLMRLRWISPKGVFVSPTLNDVLTGLPQGAVVPDLDPLPSSRIVEMVAQRIAAAGEAISSRDTKYGEQLRAALTACRSLLDRSDATFADYDLQSSRGLLLVHGDFHMGNLLISGESIFGVVDFEDVRLQTALYDLGYACVMLCAPWKQPASDKPECLNERFLRCVLDAYFGPGGEPPISLYRAVILACFLIVSWLLERSHLWQESNQEPLTCLRRMISVCKYYI